MQRFSIKIHHCHWNPCLRGSVICHQAMRVRCPST